MRFVKKTVRSQISRGGGRSGGSNEDIVIGYIADGPFGQDSSSRRPTAIIIGKNKKREQAYLWRAHHCLVHHYVNTLAPTTNPSLSEDSFLPH